MKWQVANGHDPFRCPLGAWDKRCRPILAVLPYTCGSLPEAARILCLGRDHRQRHGKGRSATIRDIRPGDSGGKCPNKPLGTGHAGVGRNTMGGEDLDGPMASTTIRQPLGVQPPAQSVRRDARNAATPRTPAPAINQRTTCAVPRGSSCACPGSPAKHSATDHAATSAIFGRVRNWRMWP